MRELRVASGLVLCLAYACTSTSSNTPTPVTDAGSGGLGGIAGRPVSAGGGGTPGAGTDGRGGGPLEMAAGTGGADATDSEAGAASGGKGDTGVTPSEGGASGASECAEDEECRNPHRPTCIAKCNGARCELAPSSSLAMAIQSGPKDAAPRAGFWDSRGTAYVVYASISSTPNYIAVQSLDADGALSGPPSTFSVPDETSEIDMIAAAFREPELALLWHGTAESTMQVVTQLSITNLEAEAGSTILLKERFTYDLYRDIPYGLFVSPLGTKNWDILTYTGKGPRWRAYTLNTEQPPAMPPLDDGELQPAPWGISLREATPAIPQSTAVVGNTLFVTGFDCEWGAGNLCEPYLALARYDRETYAPLATEFTTLSTTSYPMADQKQRQPAIARLGDQLAATWTQHTEEGVLLLGRAVFDEDGTIATMRAVEPSDLVPKALMESPDGGALLIAARVSGTDPDWTYTLVAQRLDRNLALVGAAYPLSAPSTEEPMQVNLIPSGDGRALLMFRQKYAQHRILHADLCR